MFFISPPPLLLLFSSRCAAAGISGDSLAASLQSSSLPAAMATAECLAAERSNGCGMRERSRPKRKKRKSERERERVKKWESVVWRASRATIMQRQKWGSWRDTRSQRTKMCVLLTPATGARLAACTFSHQPLPWKHATPVSKPAKRIMARARGGEERQTDIKTESERKHDSISSYNTFPKNPRVKVPVLFEFSTLDIYGLLLNILTCRVSGGHILCIGLLYIFPPVSSVSVLITLREIFTSVPPFNSAPSRWCWDLLHAHSAGNLVHAFQSH